MRHLGGIAVLSLLAMLAWPAGVAASDVTYNSTEYWTQRQAAEDAAYARQQGARTALDAARAELEALAPGAITAQQANDYFLEALEWIRSSIEDQIVDRYQMPLQLDDQLRQPSKSYAWPGDPLHDWAPLPLGEAGSAALAPGTVVYQRCPPEYYSVTRYSGSAPWITPLSFELSICGVDVAEPPAPLNSWAKLPANTLATRGFSEPPLLAMLEPWEDGAAQLAIASERDKRERSAVAYLKQNITLPVDNPNLRTDQALTYLPTVLEKTRRQEELATTLRAAPAMLALRRQLREYIENNLWLVYMAGHVHESIYGSYCFDTAVLQDKHLLPAPLLNPLNGWQPLRVLSLADGFAPGELCLQWPSSYWYGGLGSGIGPESHELSIYGFTAEDGDCEALAAYIYEYDRDWAVVPPGSLRLLSGFTQTQLQSDYRRGFGTDRLNYELPLDAQGQPVTDETLSERISDRLREGLQSKEPAQWTQQDLDEYLGFCLWSVFSTIEMYKDKQGEVPLGLPQLVELGYLKVAPLNPYNNWQPVRILTLADGFSPGDIVWQSNPDAPLGYELGIYGPDAALPVPERCRPLPQNAGWAQVPCGVRYMVGSTAETVSQVQQRILDAGAEVRAY
jgi:hypothetical protein